jgi:hypothetical protein
MQLAYTTSESRTTYFKGLGSSVENRISKNLTRKNTTDMTHPITKILSIL